ncbi:MAG: serpin family protein, partial [Anaerolineaceae bacterium]
MNNNPLSPNQPKLSFVLITVLTSVILTTSGCARGAAAEVIHSDLQRETSPQVSLADIQEVTAGNSDFAFRLYQELSEQEGNLFFSPYSISIALAMTFAGARGDTEMEMVETLAFTLPQDRLHPAFNALSLELANRAEPVETFIGKQDGPELIVANSLWGQVGHPFQLEFLDLLALNYGAGMRLVDFKDNSRAARHAINDWVSDQTKNRIRNLIPPGVLNSLTRLVLANAIYFNADWDSPFERYNTKSGKFHLLDGDQINVQMMSQAEIFPYSQGESFQLIELPYVNREIVMDILLPDHGQFYAVESSLNAEYVSGILRKLERRGVSLTMPKFEFESSFSISDTLAGMGMPSAFSSTADFSGMDGVRDLEISEVLHKAFVSVDE